MNVHRLERERELGKYAIVGYSEWPQKYFFLENKLALSTNNRVTIVM